MDDARTTVASVIGEFTAANAREGARNLLIGAAGVGEGTDLLIISDTGGHIDPDLAAGLTAFQP